MPDDVHAAMEQVKVPGAQLPLYRSLAEAELEQLPPRDDAVLPGRQSRQLPLTWALLGSTMDPDGAHAPYVARAGGLAQLRGGAVDEGGVNPQATAMRAYRESSVMTAPPEMLVVMLYDGALRFLTRAGAAMREGRHADAARPLSRAEAIVDELLATLDMEQGGEVAERLQAIYVFCRRLLVEAQLERDHQRIDQVARLLGELRDAWRQVCGA